MCRNATLDQTNNIPTLEELTAISLVPESENN